MSTADCDQRCRLRLGCNTIVNARYGEVGRRLSSSLDHANRNLRWQKT